MKELMEKVSNLIEEYFDKKIENVDWRYDLTAENTAKGIIKGCIDDVLYELQGYEGDMNRHLEEFESMYEEPSTYWEDFRADCESRARDLIDERR